MPISDAAVAQFLERLISVRSVTSRKMFGGVGLYCSGVFFAIIDDDRLFFKSDAVSDPIYDELNAPAWVTPGANGPAVMPYREVPAEVLGDDVKLGEHIDLALAVVARKAKTPKRKRN